MALKLFRSTGYSSILAPGETRVAMHPRWLVVAVSLWIGFACNVALWRALSPMAEQPRQLGWALAASLCAAAASAVVLSLLGWRRTLKPAATLLLLVAALAACGVWVQSLPVDAALLNQKPAGLMPSWASLLRWQVPAMLACLGLAPMLWVWNTHPRRLSGHEQLGANVSGMVVGGVVLVASAWLLLRG